MTLQITAGEVLAEKYQIEDRLGSGGMGEVMAARHIELGQRVAIKILHEDVGGSAEAVTRFMREGQAAARLRSTHAARVLDVGRLNSGTPYLVMEYLDGKDLSQLVGERGPLPLQEAVDYILQACEAVADAHSLGIVHRDLKPANLFLTIDPFGQKQIKVLDFGISKWSTNADDPSNTPGSMTNTAVVMGSPLYMPPEQMRSARDADERSDIWALGTILWELLTAHHLWEAETMSAICMRVASDPTPSLSAVRPDLPVALDAVLEECLQKEPIHRFQSVIDLACALAPFGGSAAPSALDRIRHFSSIGMTTVQSAEGSTNVRPSASLDSAVVAQTPASPNHRGSSPLRRLATITPDTWLSGSNPHLSPSQRGAVAFKVATIGGILATLVVGVSWWTSRRMVTNTEASPANGGLVVSEEPAIQSVKAATPATATTELLVSPTSGPDVRPVTAPSVGTIASSAPMPSPRTLPVPATKSTKRTPSTLPREHSTTNTQGTALDRSRAVPSPSAAPPSTTGPSSIPDWGGRQ